MTSTTNKLVKMKLSQFVDPNSPVITIDSSTPPMQAFQILIDNHILSAPVVDEETKLVVGCLDVADLVASALFAVETSPESRGPKSYLEYALFAPKPGDTLHPAQSHITVKYLALRRKFKPIPVDSTIGDAILRLSEPATHRLPVINVSGELIGILSQSTLVRLFASLSAEAAMSTDSFFLQPARFSAPVFSVGTQDSALHCFTLMYQRGLSGMAVVDETSGEIVGQVSSSDMKLFLKSKDPHRLLGQPIISFFAEVRQSEVGDEHANVVVVHEGAKIREVIGKLAATKMHRIFVVNGQQQPVGVIALRDILRQMIEAHPDVFHQAEVAPKKQKS